MNKAIALLAASSALLSPALALAREVTLTTTMNNNVGGGAYLAIYLTDAAGAYQGTLWVGGGKAKYYRHLPDWYRATGADPSQIDGITGASVGAGRSLTVTVDLAEALIDAGYQIRVDTSVEDGRDVSSDIAVDLTTAGAGTETAGRSYVAAFRYDM
jgi:hypothetical protein